MRLGNIFGSFQRPHAIPDNALIAAIRCSPSDTEYVSHVQDVGKLITPRQDIFAEADLYVFATLLEELAARPSTVSPVLIGVYQKAGGGSEIAAMWKRKPQCQNGFQPDWYDTADEAEPADEMLAEFAIDMPYERLQARMRAFARAKDHTWIIIYGDPYMIVENRRRSAN